MVLVDRYNKLIANGNDIGFIFGTFLTLLLLPSALYVVSDVKALIFRMKTRVELEPAYSGD